MAPAKAPRICAIQKRPTFDQFPDSSATVSVTAGLMWAPGLPKAMAVNIPATTAIPHPVVMAIHPEFSPFDFFSRTVATTPSPSKIRTSVPMNSPRNGPCIVCGPPCVYDVQPLKGHLILQFAVSLKRYPDTNLFGMPETIGVKCSDG